jgi:hypothetical protein
MRRPVVYLAGLFLATGASLALAGPASAVVSHDRPMSAVSGDDWDWVDDSYNNNGDNRNNDYSCKSNNDTHSSGLLGISITDLDLLDFSC